jgi:hypothetical protein
MKWKLDLPRYLLYAYQAVLIVAAGLTVALAIQPWKEMLVSENLSILGILLLSALIVEARPVRWTAIQHITLSPIVLLLAFMLTRDPFLVIAVSGVGAFVGYGLLRELPACVRQMPGRTVQRILFYTAQSIVATATIGRLYSLLPDSISVAFIPNALASFASVTVYILLSKIFVSSYNRLMSFHWPGDRPLPTPGFLVFFLTAIAPFITMWFYQAASQTSYILVGLLGQKIVESLAILVVWPLVLLFVYVLSPYLTLGLESEETKAEYARFSRYSEKMLNMADITELVTRDMLAEFRCDDCVVYSWNDKLRAYELEGGWIEGGMHLRRSAEDVPDIGWPKEVDPDESELGREVECGQLRFFQGSGARDFLASVGFPGYQRTSSVLLIPLRYVRAESSELVRVGFIVLLRRRGTFAHSDRVRAADRVNRQTPVHIGLRQARLYRDAQQFFAQINEGVSKSGQALAATQALFRRGIDPAKFMTDIGRGVQNHTLVRIVESVAQGHIPGTTSQVLDEEGIERLYAQIRRDNPSVPDLSPEIRDDIHAVVSSLFLSFVIPYRWPRPEHGGISPEMQALYTFLEGAFKANTIDAIIAFDAKLDDQENLSRLAVDFPEAVDQLLSLQQVIEALELSQNPELENESRVDYLSEALRMLGRADGRSPTSSELLILAQIRNSWATVVYNRRDELIGWSDLAMQLETQTAILADAAIGVDLRVSSQGRSAATDIAVRIAASDEYDILDPADGRFLVKRLEPGHSHRLSFTVHPKREDFLRIAFDAVWSDRVGTDRRALYAGRVFLQPQVQVFVPIENPYIPGPPLRPGNRLFVDRKDVSDFVRSSIGTRGQHNVLILTGQRRTGKTSLALHMPQVLDQNRYVVVYVDDQALGIEAGTDLFLRVLGMMICDGLEDYDIECEPLSLDGTGRSATERFEREFLPGVLNAIGERSLVLVFDEFEELEERVKERKLDATIFKFLRHLMQHIPDLAFVFVGSHRLRELTSDYGSILFDQALHKQIRFLDEQEARRLITEPPEQDIFDPYTVDEVIRLTAGHPYFVQLVCHYLVDLRNRSRLPIITVQHVRDAIPDILVEAEGHLTYLWHSASPLDQMVMASAARVLIGQDFVHTSDVMKQLAAYGADQDHQDILLAEEALVRQEILERLDGDPPGYRFKVELVRRWVERNQPLSLVVGSLTKE